jgi:hypothetical protein
MIPGNVTFDHTDGADAVCADVGAFGGGVWVASGMFTGIGQRWFHAYVGRPWLLAIGFHRVTT